MGLNARKTFPLHLGMLVLNTSSYFEEEKPLGDTHIHPNTDLWFQPSSSSSRLLTQGRGILPTGQAPLPTLPTPGAKTLPLWHTAQWEYRGILGSSCGNGSLPSKPGCDGNQCPVTSWQHNSNHDPQCAEPSQSSLRQPSAGPSIKAFDLLLLKGLS